MSVAEMGGVHDVLAAASVRFLPFEVGGFG